MVQSEDKLVDFIAQVLEKISVSTDAEETLFWCMNQMTQRFNCVDASIYIVDKDKKNGYIIVNGRESKQRNIPFTVRVRPEVLNYFEPNSKGILEQMENHEHGVYKFEDFVKILVPVDSSNFSFVFCELSKPDDEEIKSLKKILRLLTMILKGEIEKTEIFKLLYGISKTDDSEARERKDETLSELAGSVAHLLNQPLTSLMGSVELLIKKGEFKKQEMTSLNKIYNEAERLADVIKKIEAVNSYVTEDYLGSTKILKLDDLIQIESPAKGIKGQGKERRVSKKLEVFLEFYKAVNQSKTRGEIIHHYAFSINRMFPNLKLLMLSYKEDRGKFFLEYKEKGGYSRDFELSEERIKFYKKILDELTLKIYRFDDNSPQIITIPLVIEEEKMGIVEYDFEKEDISLFDIIIQESMTEELVLALRKLKLAEKNRYLKDYISNLIENTSSLIFVIDEQHAVRTCNPAFEEAMGLPKVEIEDKKVVDLVADESQKEEVTGAIGECFSGKVVRKIDVELLSGTKGKVDTRFSLIPLPKVKNLRPEIIAVGQNITEVKQLENQIMQSEKLAYLGHMAACVAHELNNPLTSITVFTEYLLKLLQGDFPDKFDVYKDKLDKIYDSVNRIHSFTRNLTSFAQPSEGSLSERIDINSIIKESMLFSNYEIDKDRIQIECQLDGELPEIEGYKSQLHQVFINLITNAVHALNNSSGKITLSTKNHDSDYIKVEVADNGEGMEPHVAGRIFEPFFSTRKGEGGTGLGLTIVKRIIDNHKGMIEVKSDRGKGTTFSIFLPK